MALSLGLKVDAEAMPADLAARSRPARSTSTIPRSTAELLKLNAVVGVNGLLQSGRQACEAVGIQCSLCHSTVDDSFMPGIGKRLDGWGNRDLNIGAIVAMAPNLQPFVICWVLTKRP